MDILKKMREAYLAKNDPAKIRDGALRYVNSGATDHSNGLFDFKSVLTEELQKASKAEALKGLAKSQQYYNQNFKPGGRSELPPEEELNNLYLQLLLSGK